MNRDKTDQVLAEIIKEPYLGWLKDFLETNLGLHYSNMRDNELSRKIRDAALKAGYEKAEGYINWLRTATPKRRDLELLASYITIGETYFLREGEAFDFLRYEYLNNLIYHIRKGDKKLNIWSAGCSSGEEVYSLAGLIREMLPDREKWQVRILGTDINPNVLQKARAGIYSKWSFRKTPEWFMKYVEEVDSNQYKICDCLKEMVEFRSHNLSQDLAVMQGVDVIFCRNVLIYFSKDLIRKVTAGFYDCLTEGGILVLSPVEVSLNICERFIRKYYAGRSFFIRDIHSSEPFIHSGIKYELPASACEEKDAAGSTVNELERIRFLYREGLYLRVDNLISQRADSIIDLPEEYQELLVRSKMKQKKFDEAEQYCRTINSSGADSAHTGYLLALIQIAKRHKKAARQTLTEVLAGNPDHILAVFQLGILAHQRGDYLEREKYYNEVERLLANYDEREIIDDYDDLQAGDLQRKMQEVIEGE